MQGDFLARKLSPNSIPVEIVSRDNLKPLKDPAGNYDKDYVNILSVQKTSDPIRQKLSLY